MTYYELIKNKLGDNETTERVIRYIVSNSTDAIANTAAYLDEDEFKAIKTAMTSNDTKQSYDMLKSMVEHVLLKLDVLTIPTDGQTPLFGKIGQLVAAVIKSNTELWQTEPQEVQEQESEGIDDEGVHDSEP